MKEIHYSIAKLAEEIHSSQISSMIPYHVDKIMNFVEPKIMSKYDKKILKIIGKRLSKNIGYWEKLNVDYYINYLALLELLHRNGIE